MKQSNKMELISDIATMMTEIEFGSDGFIMENPNANDIWDEAWIFTTDAQGFFNDKYDEIEGLLEHYGVIK